MRDAEQLVVEPLLAEQAPALVRCFERCYGASYVDPAFHDADRIRERVEQGVLRSVVALAGDEVVGHMGLTLRRAGDTTVDAGNTVVDPRYRNQQLAARLGLALAKRCRDEGFTAFHHYPTTAHPAVQKLAVRGGGIETGIMLDYVPAETLYRELAAGSGGGPWSAVVVYQPIAAAPARSVSVPARHAALARWLFRRCGLRRTIQCADAPLSADPTLLDARSLPRRQLLRLCVERAGADLHDRVDAAIAETPAAVVQLDLPLALPEVGAAVEALRPQGFFYCALLPEYRDGDVLRLQRLADRRDRAPDLASDDARRLLAWIEADRA